MRAIIFRHHDPSAEAYTVVDDMPQPQPGPDEVLVRVAYAALNRLDDFVRIGWKGLDLEFPHIPCSDFSGEIVAVGAGVTGWQVGQRVTANPLIWCGRCRACIAWPRQPLPQSPPDRRARAWRVCRLSSWCRHATWWRCRTGTTCALAAAASLVYVTAWHSLMVAGNLRAAERVLVVGAGGGVNTASLQIAKAGGRRPSMSWRATPRRQSAHGCWAPTGCTTARRAGLVACRLCRHRAGKGVDLVVDNVGRPPGPSSLRTLRVGGRLVTVGGTSGYAAQIPHQPDLR